MNIYQSLYDLINQYIFNNTIVVGTIPDLVATLLCTMGTIFIVAIPFIIVYRFIKILTY